MKEYYADKTCLNMMRIIIIVLTVIIISVAAFFLSFIPIIMIIVCSVFFIMGFFASLIYLPIYFRNMKYYVSDEKIVKVSGFYFIKTQTVKVSRIQYTTTISTPFSKLTGLNCILLYAYGGMLPIIFVSNRDFSEITYNLKV
ncbi:MAG: PH domain-containing protein [Oscillospiraceae bacterium]|nr:PH domain-containing protein [Oscillospiraceae bacterium]